MRTVRVRSGRAKPLWSGHPWVYADSVEHIDAPSGDETDWVQVVDAKGRAIGQGLLSDSSAIRVRLLEFGASTRDAAAVLAQRIEAAVALRKRLFPKPRTTNAYRLLHAEGDRVPGLVVDRWKDVLVAQFATAPMHRRREQLARVLLKSSGAKSLIARPAGFEREEGLAPEPVFSWGRPVPETIDIVEAGCKFQLDPHRGQKTGHYADQRENRVLVAQIAKGCHVLDLYAGTGGFSLQALRAGARTSLAVDASERSIAALQRNAATNAVSGEALDATAADVSDTLQALRGARRRFDLVIADPPNFFPRRGSDRAAKKAYRELNVRALSRVQSDGGFLATFSCSHRLDGPELLAMLQSAGRECRRTFRVLRHLTAGPDHPVAAGAPEGRYLAGLLVAVDPEVPVP